MIKNHNILFLGAPGAGKGTISALIEKKFSFFHISTGNIFRQEIANQSKLGIQVQNLVNSGKYVPDDITNKIVKKKLLELTKNSQNFILDGYPRTLDQAQFLANLNLDSFLIFNLIIDEKTIIKRLSKRLFCLKCKKTFNQDLIKNNQCPNDLEPLIRREDDEPEAIKKRMQVYHNQTFPLIKFYQKDKNYFEINSNQKPNEIVSQISKVFAKY